HREVLRQLITGYGGEGGGGNQNQSRAHGECWQGQGPDGLLAVQAIIDLFGSASLSPAGPDSHRLVFGNFVVFDNGCDEGADPVKVAIFTALFHHSQPALAGFEPVPHTRKSSLRHVWVAYDVVGLTNHLGGSQA